MKRRLAKLGYFAIAVDHYYRQGDVTKFTDNQEIFAKVVEIKSEGVSVLLVEHNARRALAIADYGYVLEVGLNRYEGRGRELLHDPNVVRLYLGGMMDKSKSAPRADG